MTHISYTDVYLVLFSSPRRFYSIRTFPRNWIPVLWYHKSTILAVLQCISQNHSYKISGTTVLSVRFLFTIYFHDHRVLLRSKIDAGRSFFSRKPSWGGIETFLTSDLCFHSVLGQDFIYNLELSALIFRFGTRENQGTTLSVLLFLFMFFIRASLSIFFNHQALLCFALMSYRLSKRLYTWFRPIS